MKKRIEYDEQLNVTNDLIVKPNASLYDKGECSNKPLELGFSLTSGALPTASGHVTVQTYSITTMGNSLGGLEPTIPWVNLSL